MEKTVKRTEKAFQKGLNNLRMIDYLPVKREIYTILGISARQTFKAYAEGRRELDVDKYNRIEKVFHDHGVKDCWGR